MGKRALVPVEKFTGRRKCSTYYFILCHVVEDLSSTWRTHCQHPVPCPHLQIIRNTLHTLEMPALRPVQWSTTALAGFNAAYIHNPCLLWVENWNIKDQDLISHIRGILCSSATLFQSCSTHKLFLLCLRFIALKSTIFDDPLLISSLIS